MDIGPGELIVILVVVLVLFGGSQLPKLARSIGEAQREFRRGMDHREPEREPEARREPEPAPAPVPPPAPAPAPERAPATGDGPVS